MLRLHRMVMRVVIWKVRREEDDSAVSIQVVRLVMVGNGEGGVLVMLHVCTSHSMVVSGVEASRGESSTGVERW